MSLATPEKIRRLQRKLYLKAKAEPDFRFYALYDKIWRSDILHHAYALARANRGAPGVDGQTFRQIEASGLETWLSGLQEELRAHTYRPQPVRRVMIPKPDGGERPLGIPTVRDRVVQTAAKLVIEPIFEADLEPNSYAYRPGRSATDAVKEVHGLLIQGYTDVVDADLSRYFDTIPHADLLRSVTRRISDRYVLRLIKKWLKAPIVETDARGKRFMSGGQHSTCGTPQGGVISPLLASVYMNRFLKYWRISGAAEQLQARVVAYADDLVILSKGQAAAARDRADRVLTRMGLTLNPVKTSLVDARSASFDFLGYTFGPHRYRKDGRWYLGASPSKASVRRLTQRVNAVMTRGHPAPWPTLRDRLNRLLRGWAGYFNYGTRLMAYRAVDKHVYQRTQKFLVQRHKVPTRGTRRFTDRTVFEEMGVLRLRTLHVGAPPWASR